jgi:hypothetical protein
MLTLSNLMLTLSEFVLNQVFSQTFLQQQLDINLLTLQGDQQDCGRESTR